MLDIASQTVADKKQVYQDMHLSAFGKKALLK